MNILSLTYMGNVRWFTKLCFEPCVIDIHEHFVKQSYRNRCEIMTANGLSPLIVNTVKSPNDNKATMRETRINYSKRWQHQQWMSIVSAFRNSPYFDHYADEFEPFFRRRYEFLWDLNRELLQTILGLLGVGADLTFSDSYLDTSALQGEAPGNFDDLRDAISPKPRLDRPDPDFVPVPYWQVFADRHGFVPNLSVIDLLMCEGPGAAGILRRSCKK